MTISEIAKLAGVSTSTVSKVMNNKAGSIPPETRERVLKIVKEYNYTPYGAAKSSSQAKTFLLAVLLRASGKANQLISGILQTAQAHGYSVLVFDSQENPELELKHITSICQKRADGILWEPVGRQSTDYAHYLTEADIAICYMDGTPAANSCTIDFMQMGYALTQKLIDYKHNRIGCLIKPGSYRSAQLLEGYKKCLYSNQIPFEEQLVLSSEDEELSLKIMAFHATGIVSSHFSAALMLYEQFNKLHYRIPDDLSLVSLKNDISDSAAFPHITSLEVPYLGFGRFVCERLVAQCEKKLSGFSGTVFTPSCVLNHEESIDIPSSLRFKKIVVVGSINLDNTFNVDWLPQAGKTTRIQSATVSH